MSMDMEVWAAAPLLTLPQLGATSLGTGLHSPAPDPAAYIEIHSGSIGLNSFHVFDYVE